MEKREEDWALHYQSLLGLALEQCWDLDEFRKASQDTKHYCYKESLEAGIPSNLTPHPTFRYPQLEAVETISNPITEAK